jgi:hypothetical protein
MEIAGNETVMPPSPNSWETAVHEAGHVVVGLALGFKPLSVSVSGQDGLAVLDPGASFIFGWAAHTRRDLAVDVAGVVAEEMFSVWGGEATPLPDARARFRECLRRATLARPRVSECLRHATLDEFPVADEGAVLGELLVADEEAAFLKAEALAWSSASLAYARVPSRPPVAVPEVIVAEVERAERRAERILRQRRADVLKLARSLCRRKSGRLTAGQVRRLLRAA